MTDSGKNIIKRVWSAIKGDEGMALVVTLLLLLLITALGMGAIMLGSTDSALSGNYRLLKSGAAATDGGIDLAMQAIFNGYSVPGRGRVPVGINTAWKGWSSIPYKDGDIDIKFNVKYKKVDTINYVTPVTSDGIVRYGQDYNYASAVPLKGSQPVYTVTVTDNKTKMRAQADLITTMAFKTVGALFVKGAVRIHKDGLATDEHIYFQSGDWNMPALVTTQTKASGNVRIQHVVSKSATSADNCGSGPPARGNTNMTYVDDQGVTMYYYKSAQVTGSDGKVYTCAPGVTGGHTSSSTNKPITGAQWSTVWTLGGTAGAPAWASGVYYPAAFITAYDSNGNKLADSAGNPIGMDLYTDSQISAEMNSTLRRAKQHILFSCVTAYCQTNPQVVQYSYPLPASANIENMMGATFADLRSIATTVETGTLTQQVPNDTGGTVSTGGVFDASDKVYGSQATPVVVFFNSNMNDDGTANSSPQITMVTQAGKQMKGWGILIINGDAKICGSINWMGLMIVRGTLYFRPWQGGDWCTQSGPDLMSKWNGFLMIGRDLDMQTLAGGTLELGYGMDKDGKDSSKIIRQIISDAIPRKFLSWRRIYQ